MGSGFSRKRVYQCSYGRASAYVGGQNLLTSDVIYQLWGSRRQCAGTSADYPDAVTLATRIINKTPSRSTSLRPWR
jgi:hypothetical protein